MQELGEDPRKAVMRVGMILNHGKSKPLNDRELETLRKAKFLFDSMSGPPAKELCDMDKKCCNK